MTEERIQWLKTVRRYAQTHTHRQTIEWLIAMHGEENMGPAEADEVLQELDYALDRGYIK